MRRLAVPDAGVGLDPVVRMNPPYQVVLFDLDGTLCDPGDGITSAAQHALQSLGLHERDAQALRRFVGPPLEHAFRDLYSLSDEQVTAAVRHYREHYRAHGLGQYRAYPGIPDLLADLRAAGVRLGVVTAKIQEFAEQALRDTGLRQYVTSVHGRAPDEVVSKDVTLGQALRLLDRPRSVVLVGDREHDVHAAHEHGIDVIGVLYGYGTERELASAGATTTASSPADLHRLLLADHL